jgi:hypothetical protein
MWYMVLALLDLSLQLRWRQWEHRLMGWSTVYNSLPSFWQRTPHQKRLHLFYALNAVTGFWNLKHKSSPLSVSKEHRRLCRKARHIERYPSFVAGRWTIPLSSLGSQANTSQKFKCDTLHRGVHQTLAHQIKNFYCVFQYLGRFCTIELHMYVLVRYMIKLM